jgi:hypothetical protein
MSTIHVCSSHVFPAEPGTLRRVCGMCWFVHDGCECWAVDDVGTVMLDGSGWQAMWGDDLMDRYGAGVFGTKEEAAEHLRAMRDNAPHLACRKCDWLPWCATVKRERSGGGDSL